MIRPARVSLVAAMIAAAVTATAQSPVTITELGTLGGDFSVALAINDAGDAVGYSQVNGPGGMRATLWSGGVLHQLPTLCGNACPAGTNSYAMGINGVGDIVGASTTTSGAIRAALWIAGTVAELPPLPGDTESWAYDINDAGVAVGYSSGSSGRRAVKWTDGSPASLGVIGSNGGFSFSAAYDINNAGQVVGESSTSTGTVHAFLWDAGVMVDLGAPAGQGSCSFSRSAATGINAAGEISGWGYVGCSQRALRWSGGVVTELAPVAGTGISTTALHSINDAGDITGFSAMPFPECFGTHHAVIWSAGTPQDLGTLSADRCRESFGGAINNRGQVAGRVVLDNGSIRAAIFSTEQPDTTPPALSAVVPATAALWPPDHRMVSVPLLYTVSDAVSTPVCTVDVSSNEAADGPGDGSTDSDWRVIDARTVELRAERSGRGTGRVYGLTVTCRDEAGNQSSETTTVAVPHSRR